MRDKDEAKAVIDASALAAVVFGEPEGDEIAPRFEGVHLLAPSLLRYEIANVALVKARRYPDRRGLLEAAFEHFLLSPIEYVGVDLVEALAVAQRRGVTAYDTAYVWLARSRGAALITLDKKMTAAFEAESATNR